MTKILSNILTSEMLMIVKFHENPTTRKKFIFVTLFGFNSKITAQSKDSIYSCRITIFFINYLKKLITNRIYGILFAASIFLLVSRYYHVMLRSRCKRIERSSRVRERKMIIRVLGVRVVKSNCNLKLKCGML